MLASRVLLAGWLLSACAHLPKPSPALIAVASLPIVESARISPDGTRVAYVSDASGTKELWVASTKDGSTRALTRMKERVDAPRWSPDGETLFAAVDTGGNERFDLFAVGAGGGAPSHLSRTPKISESGPVPSPDGRHLAFTADPDTPFRAQLFVRELATGMTRPLTREAVAVYQPVWSRDSRTLAITQTADDLKGRLLVLDVTSGDIRRVEPPVAGGILWAHAFLADGRILVRARNSVGFMQLALVSLEIGTTASRVRFVGPADWDVEEALWHPSEGFYFLRNEGGASALYQMVSSGPSRGQLATPRAAPTLLHRSAGVLSSLSIARDGQRLAYLEGFAHAPPTVRILDKTQAPREIVPAPLPAGLRLARGEVIRYRSFDGLDIHANVLRPPPLVGTAPWPCIVVAHGGPDSQARPALDLTSQALALAGFVVLVPNYRGSTGYGKRFQDANDKDWGGGDLKDLLAGIEHLAQKGEIDRSRTGILGGSFGGYLALLALGRQPTVYRAGVSLYGMADLVHDYTLTKDRYGAWYASEMGTPETHAALFKERSPVTYLDKMRAPLLVLQGANDSDVPKVESDLVVERLRARKHSVDYHVYANEGHVFTRRENRLDAAARIVRFFEQHL